MCSENQTIKELVLLGFQNIGQIRIILFCFITVVYTCTVVGNLLIIFLVSTNYNLQQPMYLFISNLALADFILSTTIVPNMMSVLWSEGGTITLDGCIAQFFFAITTASAQCCLLMVMAFDRYLAICLPLRYSSLMSVNLSLCLVAMCWSVGVLLINIEVILICQLEFCTSSVINHFFCDLAPLLTLSSTDVSGIIWLDFSLDVFVIFLPFVCIIISYLCIFSSVFNMSSVIGRMKAVSTCSSHLIVVCTYYGSLIAVYMAPDHETFNSENKLRSLLFVMLTPFANPMVYSLRNKDIKDALLKTFTRRQWLC